MKIGKQGEAFFVKKTNEKSYKIDRSSPNKYKNIDKNEIVLNINLDNEILVHTNINENRGRSFSADDVQITFNTNNSSFSNYQINSALTKTKSICSTNSLESLGTSKNIIPFPNINDTNIQDKIDTNHPIETISNDGIPDFQSDESNSFRGSFSSICSDNVLLTRQRSYSDPSILTSNQGTSNKIESYVDSTNDSSIEYNTSPIDLTATSTTVINSNINPTSPLNWTWSWGDLPTKHLKKIPIIVENDIENDLKDSSFHDTISCVNKLNDIINDSLTYTDTNELGDGQLLTYFDIDTTENIINSNDIFIESNTNDKVDSSISDKVMSTNTFYSLSGHILSMEDDAPEPMPISSLSLLEILVSYRIPDNNFDNIYSEHSTNNSLVVIIHDYLLNLEVFTVLYKKLNQIEDISNELFLLSSIDKNFLNSEIIQETIKELKSMESSVSLPPWIGKKISGWSMLSFSQSLPLVSESIASHEDKINVVRIETDEKLLSLDSTCSELVINSYIKQEMDTDNNDNNTDDDDEDDNIDDGTDLEQISLEDIPFDEISPEPPIGSEFYESDTDSYLSLSLEDGEGGGGSRSPRKYRYRRVLVPSQDQLKSFNLKDGENEIIFELNDNSCITSQMFVWSDDAKIVVTDIEGCISINKSNQGTWGSFLGTSKACIHDGVAKLLSNIHNHGYHILYITQNMTTISTKEQLAKVVQGTGSEIPPGPVFRSPESLIRVFGAGRTDLFKAAALRGVKGLFPVSHNPYYACFGSKACDMIAYNRCGVPEGRVFLVSNKGSIKGMNNIYSRTFEQVNDGLNENFPPIADNQAKKQQSILEHNKSYDDSYNDFNFWKTPIVAITSSSKL
jgi:hypothetical protein